MARIILGEEVIQAHIILYESFAATYWGHGTDRVIISGLRDLETDDERVKTAFDLALLVVVLQQWRLQQQ